MKKTIPADRSMTFLLTEEQKEQRRRKRERWIIFITLGVMVGMTLWETYIVRPDFPFSLSQRVVLFALINLNSILLLLLVFLVIRNLVKLVTERRRKVLGSKIRTRLVLSFITLSLVPTLVLFFVAYQFTAMGMEYWFNIHIERALQDSLDVGRSYYQAIRQGTRLYAQQIGWDLRQSGILEKNNPRDLERMLWEKRTEYKLAWVAVFLPNLEEKAKAVTPEPG